jgi:hypothetical protein
MPSTHCVSCPMSWSHPTCSLAPTMRSRLWTLALARCYDICFVPLYFAHVACSMECLAANQDIPVCKSLLVMFLLCGVIWSSWFFVHFNTIHYQKYCYRMFPIKSCSSWTVSKTLSRVVHIVMPISIIGGRVISSSSPWRTAADNSKYY